MSIRFENQYATFWGITEKHEKDGKKRLVVKLSTSEKKQDGSREYSSWFVTVFGNAVSFFETLQEKDFIVVSGKMTRLPFNKADGTKSWRQEAVVFQASKYEEQAPQVPVVAEDSGFDIPF